MNDLRTVFTANPFSGYTYSYPHKTAYRSFAQPIDLGEAWADENLDSVFLYLHIPFCEYRCGFCNLFTHALPKSELIREYLNQIKNHARVIKELLPKANFSRIAIGGGTPTFLDTNELESLLTSVADIMEVDPKSVPVSCEASPATVTREKLEFLKDWGVDRISFGIQSMLDQESKNLGRPQKAVDVESALNLISNFDFPVVNLDLIYGARDQNEKSWLYSIQKILEFQPEEIFLYPLYVRDLTGLDRIHDNHFENDERMSLYEIARDRLLDSGYDRHSLRMFRRSDATINEGPVYCCQSDAMIGLGCGARSYTRSLHYSTEWAVGRSGVLELIKDYVMRKPGEFRTAWHGIQLDLAEQKRRFVLMSLLQREGLATSFYTRQFGSQIIQDFPEIKHLIDSGFVEQDDQAIRPTGLGLDYSDAIGPWMYSEQVKALMGEYVCH